MGIAYIETEEDYRIADEEWKRFERRGFFATPGWNQWDKSVALCFKEGEWIADKLIPNHEGTEYRSVIIPDKWREHGVREVWVMFERHKSIIHVLMEGESEPFIHTKHYN